MSKKIYRVEITYRKDTDTYHIKTDIEDVLDFLGFFLTLELARAPDSPEDESHLDGAFIRLDHYVDTDEVRVTTSCKSRSTRNNHIYNIMSRGLYDPSVYVTYT